MKKISVLLVFLFLSLFIQAQDTYRDTLKLNLAEKEDGKRYLYDLMASEKLDYRLAVLNNQLGLTYQYESNLDSAFLCHKQALYHSYKVNQYNQEIGVSYNKIGVIYYYRGELDSAILFFERAIPFYQEQKLRANSYNNLALMNKYNANPDVAIENYLLAHDTYKEIGDTLKQVWVLNNIGALYNDLEDYEKGEDYVKRGLDLAVGDEFKEAKYSCLANLANIYNNTNKQNEAIPILTDVVGYYISKKDYNFLIVNQNNLAESYDGIGEKQKALNLFLETLQLMEETGIENNKEAILLNIGSSYEEMEDYTSALSYYQRSMKFAQDNDFVVRFEVIYKSLSSVHLKLNNADSSIYYKDLQIHLKDSLDNIEKEKKMMELEAEHHTKELNSDLAFKENQLNDTERERELLSTSFTYSLLIILVTVFGVVIFYGRYRKKKLLADDLSLRNQKNNENITELKSTIGLKDEEIEGLSHKQETGKLPFPKNLTPLTEREKEVLVGVKDGLKDQEIADRLFISIATVRTHLRKAYVKIDARNRAEAIQFISEFEI